MRRGPQFSASCLGRHTSLLRANRQTLLHPTAFSRGIITRPGARLLEKYESRFFWDVSWVLRSMRKYPTRIELGRDPHQFKHFPRDLIQRIGKLYRVEKLTWRNAVLPQGIPRDLVISPFGPDSTPVHMLLNRTLYDSLVELAPFGAHSPDWISRFPGIDPPVLEARLRTRELISPLVALLPVDDTSSSIIVSNEPVRDMDRILHDAIRKDPRAQNLIALIHLWTQSGKLRQYPASWTALLVLWFLKTDAADFHKYDWVPPDKISTWTQTTSFGGRRVDGIWPRNIRRIFLDYLSFYADGQAEAFKALYDPTSGQYKASVSVPSELDYYVARISAGLSQTFWATFRDQAIQTQRVLGNGCPAGTIFGGSLSPVKRGMSDASVFFQNLYESTRASMEVLLQRTDLVKRIENLVQAEFGSQYRCEIFGSVSVGTDGPESDLDLTVIDPDKPLGAPPDVRVWPSIYSVKTLGNDLRHSGFWSFAIPSTVPIVKIRDARSGIRADISVNNRQGLAASRLINRYFELMPTLRPLITFVKHWKNCLHLNRKPRTDVIPLTNYALTLMTIAMFQNLGYLPNLQGHLEGEPDDVEGETFWCQAATTGLRVKCDLRFDQLKHWASERETLTLDEVIRKWFWYWGQGFDFNNALLSVREGGLVQRDLPCWVDFRTHHCYNAEHTAVTPVNTRRPHLQKEFSRAAASQPERWEDHVLVVPDPFVAARNTAEGVNGLILGQFVNECEHAYEMLRLGMDIQQVTPHLKHNEMPTPKKHKRTPGVQSSLHDWRMPQAVTPDIPQGRAVPATKLSPHSMTHSGSG